MSLPRYDDAGEPLMRTARILLCACAAVAAAPLAIGGVVVTAVATTLAGAVPVAPATACRPSARAGVAGTIDRWITRTVPGSPLAGTGAAMVAGAAGTGLDPRLLAAIALQETRLGTAGGGPAVFNPFGLGPGLAFSSWAGAIALAVRTLVTMHAGGAQTIAEISVHWAPIGAANDPGGLNASWSGGVGSAYAELGGDPAGPVFGSLSGPRGAAPAGCAAASHGRTA